MGCCALLLPLILVLIAASSAALAICCARHDARSRCCCMYASEYWPGERGSSWRAGARAHAAAAERGRQGRRDCVQLLRSVPWSVVRVVLAGGRSSNHTSKLQCITQRRRALVALVLICLHAAACVKAVHHSRRSVCAGSRGLCWCVRQNVAGTECVWRLRHVCCGRVVASNMAGLVLACATCSATCSAEALLLW